jgi:hypothetical protein
LVLGGKHDLKGQPVNTVEMISSLSQIELKRQWINLEPMIEARMCFSAIVIDKKNVYVFGGIKGSVKHEPIMVSNAIEHFTIESN